MGGDTDLWEGSDELDVHVYDKRKDRRREIELGNESTYRYDIQYIITRPTPCMSVLLLRNIVCASAAPPRGVG
jgi:hypothetical protein